MTAIFPAVWEIYKHQAFIFISTRGQYVTIRFFSSISANCMQKGNLASDYLDMILIILYMWHNFKYF